MAAVLARCATFRQAASIGCRTGRASQPIASLFVPASIDQPARLRQSSFLTSSPNHAFSVPVFGSEGRTDTRKAGFSVLAAAGMHASANMAPSKDTIGKTITCKGECHYCWFLNVAEGNTPDCTFTDQQTYVLSVKVIALMLLKLLA